MRLINADNLKYKNLAEVNGKLTYVLTAEEIDNAPTVEINKELKVKAETYKAAYQIMSDAFENEVRKNHRPQGEWLTIDDIMSVFDDFMRGDISENDTEVFLEMLKDKIEQRGKEE